MHSLTAQLCEVRDTDGTVYPATAVDPGESVDWPQRIAGFEGWAAPIPEGVEPAPAESEPAEADISAPAKSRSKASVKATDTPEVAA
jgi:hypothetical protein